MRNILLDYDAANEISPYEYMQTYIEKCPDQTGNLKLTWIADTFLSIQKHKVFLKEISGHFSEKLTEEEQDYFMIILHAITFQVDPKDMALLFKTLFNISKSLLATFTKFLSNNEILTYISDVAQGNYDTKYVTEKIISPLFTWQPYISEMAHSYATYLKKVESRRMKPPTIPVQPTVLNRKSNKETTSLPEIVPNTPPNSKVRIKSKIMLTKSVIDRRLQTLKNNNKQKASNLLNAVKNYDFHYAQPKSDDIYQRNKYEFHQIEPLTKPKKVVLNTNLPPIRENVALVQRYNKRKQQVEQEEIDWLHDLLSCCRNQSRVDELNELERNEREKERLYDIERKHLLGQLSYEEAVLAKKKVHEQNKKKYKEYLKDKQLWNDTIEKWKMKQLEYCREQMEKCLMIDLNIAAVRNEIAEKKRENAARVKKETAELYAESLKLKQEEMEKKIKMIKEIKVLSLIAKKAKVPKIIDLTESSGLGLMCEMSIAELQERIAAMKISIKEELERKKAQIKANNDTAKKEFAEVKRSVKKFMSERESIRKLNISKNSSKTNITLDAVSSKEIEDLKKLLERKRSLRMNM